MIHARLTLTCAVLGLFTGVGTAGELLGPTPITVGGKILDVEHVGHAAPFVGDFDRDGVKDLLVGEFYKGCLRIYPNHGSNANPRFDTFSLFQNGALSGCIHAS